MDYSLRVATSDWSVEFKPWRVVWQRPDTFTVSGLGKGRNVRRVTLRFRNPEAAQRAVSLVKERVVAEELLAPQGEEIDVEIRYSTPKLIIFAIFLSFLPQILLLGGVGVMIVINAPQLVVVWTIAVVIFAIGFRVTRGFLFGHLLNRELTPDNVFWGKSSKGWLRFEGKQVSLRIGFVLDSVTASAISWKGLRSFILKGDGRLMELGFLNFEDAIRAAQLIRDNFPKVDEGYLETYASGSHAQ